jgi:hypothetical protein
MHINPYEHHRVRAQTHLVQSLNVRVSRGYCQVSLKQITFKFTWYNLVYRTPIAQNLREKIEK